MNPSDGAVERALAGSRKYAHLCPAVVRRVIGEETPKYARDKERIKAVKNRLHQIYGAYVEDGALERALRLWAATADPAPADVLKDVCRQMLALHASTRERLAAAEAFYGFVMAHCGPLRTVGDVGCGLHPFVLPLLDIPLLERVYAWDIDLRIPFLVNGLLARMGLPAGARAMDAVEEDPPQAVDVAFVLKLLPVLETQRKGRALGLLLGLRARRLVVSFPARSLSGRDKGMARGYAAQYEGQWAGHFTILAKEVIGQELTYVLEKPNGP